MLRFSAETQQSKIRAQIEKMLERAAPGDKLPSQPELATQFGCSRTMIRDIIGRLEAEGFVTRRQGSGTFVNQTPIGPNESLQHFVDFPTLISRMGYQPSICQLGIVLQPAGRFFVERFRIQHSDKVITRRCLYNADDHFCVLAEDSFPSSVITRGQYNTLCQSENTDLRLFLFSATGRTPYRDETTLSVVTAEDYPFLLTLLSDSRAPLLFMSSLCFDAQNQPFTCSQIYSDTTYIHYKLNRQML